MVEDVEVPKDEALLELTERLCESGRWEDFAEKWPRAFRERLYVDIYGSADPSFDKSGVVTFEALNPLDSSSITNTLITWLLNTSS